MTAPTVPEMKALGSSSPKSEDTHRAAEGAVVARHDIMGGVPCIAGTRIPAQSVREFAEAGYTYDEIVREYPTLTFAQIDAALAYTAPDAASTASQVDIGPLADEPKIVPAPTEKGDGVVVVPRERLRAVCDELESALAEAKINCDGSKLSVAFADGVIDTYRRVRPVWSAMIAATQQATGEGVVGPDNFSAVGKFFLAVDHLTRMTWRWGESCGIDDVSWDGTGDSYNETCRDDHRKAKRALVEAFHAAVAEKVAQALATQQAVSPSEGVGEYSSASLKAAALAAMAELANGEPDGWFKEQQLTALAAARAGEMDEHWPKSERAIRVFLDALHSRRNAADGGSSNEGG